jgi:hypothetical protein
MFPNGTDAPTLSIELLIASIASADGDNQLEMCTLYLRISALGLFL